MSEQAPVAVVTGSGSGLGAAIVKALREVGVEVVEWDIASGPQFDIKGPTAPIPDRVDILVNCAGINAIRPIPEIQLKDFLDVMSINVFGMMAMSQYLLDRLIESKGVICNIVSNASHIPMTHSFIYNTSKGAAAIGTKQMARELTKAHGITVFGISPNKLRGTAMSRYIEQQVLSTRGWTAEEADAHQKAALLTGKETEPEQVAEFAAFLLAKKSRHDQLSGCILDYGV